MRGFKPRRAKRNLLKAGSILRAAGFTESRPLKFTILVARTDALPAEPAAWSRAFSGTRASAPDCDAMTLKALSLTDIDARNAQYGKADECLMSHHVLLPLASLEPRYALIRKPWSFMRKSRYNLSPYSVSLWKRDED